MGEGNSTQEKAASIRAEVDGTPGTNNMPGRLIFSTSADGSDSPTERLRITADGQTTIKNFVGTGLKLEGANASYSGMQFVTTDSSASTTRNIFIDAVNETGAAVANQVGAVQADGGSMWSWSTQPPGNRTDRRVERLRITADGTLAYNYDTAVSTIAGVDLRTNSGVHIRGANGNSDNTNIYIGGSYLNQRKCAVIFDPVGGYCRGDLHFCMDNVADLTDVVQGDSKMVMKANGDIGIRTQSPFNRFQVGGHTFNGGHGMYSNARVGMSNHGSLTGLMLASTYNDANHPEYGLVFIQGPTTSNYNAWSISPDGPAKGNDLNLHYAANASNIHVSTQRKFAFTGAGQFLAPLQPSFCAKGVTGHTGSTDPVDYTQELFDVGGNYNNAAGTSGFTAPVTGKYFFHATVMLSNYTTMTDFDYLFLDFTVNGNSQGRERMMPRPSGGTFATIENSVILSLSASQVVKVKIVQSGGTAVTIRNDYRFFEGYLIG